MTTIRDWFPGVRDDEPGAEFLPPDPDLPAAPVMDYPIGQLLEEIADNTRPKDQGVTWFPLHLPLPAAAGETSARIPLSVRHIYLPPVDRPMTVWSGNARDILLAHLLPGQGLDVELPYPTDGLSIEWEAVPLPTVLTAYLSSHELDINIVGATTSAEPPVTLSATPGLYATTGATANTDPGGIAIPAGATAVMLWFEESATSPFRVGGRVAFNTSATALTGISGTSTNMAYVSDVPQSFAVPVGATHIHIASATANAVVRGQWYTGG